MRKADDSRRDRILAKAIADIQLDPNNPLHDGPVSTVDDEQLASEIVRMMPWIRGTRSWTEFLNEVRAVATRLGYLKGNAQVAAYTRAGLSDPSKRLKAMQAGAGKGLSLSVAEWPAPTGEQLRAAGVFPSRAAAGVALGLNQAGQAPAAMTPERVRQVVAELEASRGHNGSPL
jgi:hypothetical protein